MALYLQKYEEDSITLPEKQQMVHNINPQLEVDLVFFKIQISLELY